MKQIMLFIIITTFSITARSANLLDGYIVMSNNDTVRCKMKNVHFYGITKIDSEGNKEVFRAKDKSVIAFGYVERGKRYDFLYVEAGNKEEHGFYQRLINGPKYKLYGRPSTVQGGNPTYVLFNLSSEFTKFEPCVLCPWKKLLREFLKDDAKALELVENAPRYNIPQFVVDINKA